MPEQKNYFAIIPANVRYDTNLKDKAKLLYGEITALCNEKGYCWATNEYFANLYGVSKTTISLLIRNLIDGGYIKSEIIYKEGTKEILNRYLSIIKDPIKENLNTPIKENLKDNNTYINNTFNNKKERKKENYDSIINKTIDDEDVKNTIYEFIKMRKLIKKPMTDRALTMLINKLKKLSSDKEIQIKILEKSILKNWTDIYEYKEEAKNGITQRYNKQDLSKYDR